MTEQRTAPFGEQLRRLREAAGITQEELAERAGLSRDAVSALERGHRRHPHPQTVRALAAGLGLSERDVAALRAGVPKRSGGPPPPAIEARSPPLPVPLTRLVGRQRELAELRRLLTGGAARLVTLTGPGGVGKTRLALELAADLAPAFSGAVAFVSLAAVQDPALVLPTAAEALGVREAGGRPLAERAGQVLRDRRFLLVLDNLEHLVEAAAPVAELLAACPGLVVLATSRSPLRLSGEHEYPVPPLAAPLPNRPAALPSLAANDAVALFVQRARAAKPDFALTEANAVAVAEICARLDGLPLAIELAAAWVKVLPPDAMLGRLGSRLDLLTGGPQDQAPRLRSMRAAIDWSYGLLDDVERALFRRLSVFAGGFTAGAAAAVCGTGEAEALEGIGALVDRSLVRPLGTVAGEPRYGMLETVREFGRERLEASGRGTAVRDALAAAFLRRAEDVAPELQGKDPSTTLCQLEAEHDNLRAALDHLLRTGRVEEAARLLWALWGFWWTRGHHAEGRRWATRLLAKRDVLTARSLGRTLTVLGVMGYGLGLYEGLVPPLEEGVDLLLQVNDEPGAAVAVSALGLSLVRVGNLERGERLLEEGVVRLHRVGDEGRAAQVLTLLGVIPFNRGDYRQALARFEEGLVMARASANPQALCVALFDVGLARHAVGDLAGAAVAYHEGLLVARDLGEPIFAAHLVEGLAGLAAATGELERAALLFGGSRAHLAALEVSSAVRAGERAFLARTLEQARAAAGEQAWARAWEEGETLTRDELVAAALGEEVVRWDAEQ